MNPPEGLPVPLVLFDGPCTLCNRSVRFLLRHERNPELTFASIQSETGQKAIDHYPELDQNLDAMILVEADRVFHSSDAAIRLCGYLRNPWRMGRVFGWLPTSVHRALYRWIARNRYHWFGKDESCPLPNPEQADRFV